MNGKTFTKSLKYLALSILVIVAFFSAPKYQWMYFAVFGCWLLFTLICFIASRSKKISGKLKHAKQKYKKVKAECIRPEFLNSDEDDSSAKVLLTHLGCRITDKLKSAYPDATWKWACANPELIAGGGTGRIKTSGTGEFNYADVTVDGFFRISFSMMKIVDLTDMESRKPDTEDTATRPPEAVDVSVWFDLIGRETLTDVITELNTCGHSRLYIKENGEVCVVEDGLEVRKEELKNLPGKGTWEALTDVLASNGLSANVEADRIAVSWS